jgi:hypothetical protein
MAPFLLDFNGFNLEPNGLVSPVASVTSVFAESIH